MFSRFGKLVEGEAEGVTRELGARADNGLGPYTSLIKTAFMGGIISCPVD